MLIHLNFISVFGNRPRYFNVKNKEYFGILDGLRVKVMELFTLYMIWIGENYEEDEIIELFSKPAPCVRLRKGFEYVASMQSAGLTESQAITFLDLFYLILISKYTPEKISEFFAHRKLAKPDDPFLKKVYKACRHCGALVCYHKAKGLCNFCYHKLWIKKQIKK